MELAWYACRPELAKRPDEHRDCGQARDEYARDRDRILYSKAFRRLSHKTQVYLTTENNPEPNEHLRTRLTHSLEVAQIARSIARPLRLNSDLIEAMCLGHDVGHAPFGHAGERQLDDILHARVPLPRIIAEKFTTEARSKRSLRDFGDFRHNFQSVRQLSFLETYQHSVPPHGLNLTYQCLDGILRHTGLNSLDRRRNFCKYPWLTASRTDPDNILVKLKDRIGFAPTLEARIVEMADGVAQICHDLSDAIELDVLEFAKFCDLVPGHIEAARDYVHRKTNKEYEFDGLGNKNENNAKVFSVLVCYFILRTYEEVEKVVSPLPEDTPIAEILARLGNDPSPKDTFNDLKTVKNEIVVNNYSVNRMDNKGRHIIRELYKAYLCDLRQLPDDVLERYLLVKRKEFDGNRALAPKWLADRGRFFTGHDDKAKKASKHELSEDEIRRVVEGAENCRTGKDLRNQTYVSIARLMPYLALDGDYVRAIVDYIASMTDAFAEREMAALYGF